MRSLLSLVILSLGLLAAAEPALSPYTLHEKRTHVPAGWSLKRRHDASTVVPLRFALTQKNIDEVGKYLMEVSHPKSENYGKHWTAGEVIKTFAPSEESIEAVRSWLLESGFESDRINLTPNKGWIEVSATVEEAERLLQTEYNLYAHTTGKEHVACDSYHLPAHISPHVDFVTPTVHFDAKLNRRSTEPARTIGQPGAGSGPKTTGKLNGTPLGDLSTCNEYITLDCLRALYGLYYTPSAVEQNSYGIGEWKQKDYTGFVDGEFELVYGTSCSSPVSGAIFTMINDARLSAGKSTIGFINPTIYSASFADLFNDITMGDNPGCGTDGFNATVGWDPVTGLGTPNFPKLLAAWLELS